MWFARPLFLRRGLTRPHREATPACRNAFRRTGTGAPWKNGKNSGRSINPSPWLPSRGAGFTLIEILVTTAISVLLAAIVITYSSGARERNALSIESAKVGESVLRARSLALATYGAPGGAGVGACGYGVSIDYALQEFTLFRYLRGPGPASCSLLTQNNVFLVPPRIDPLETHALAPEVIVVPDADPCKTLTEALFVPPDPRTLLITQDRIACGPLISEARIRIATRDQTFGTTIVVNQFGQLSYE